ncbi:GNAT family N-acetyltransferase [Balneolales bacterium ANBcel1]|nr:GNAT family N-acetyltransferase [Balneolales bacterium ANBcel1]
MPSQPVCRIVSAEDILPLRARELRSGKPADSAAFPEDTFPDTLHFAAYIDGTIAGCLTLIPRNTPHPAWQLRGMATDSPFQRMGIGSSLLTFAETHLRSKQNPLHIWCNARVAAVPFYKKSGYRVISQGFIIQDIGLHYKMEKIIL